MIKNRKDALDFLEHFEVNDDHYFVYEFMPKGDLRNACSCKKGKRLPSFEARRVMQDLAKVLDELYELNIIHRNVIPENIWISGDSGSVKLSGFDHSIIGSPHEGQKVPPRKPTPYDPIEVLEGHARSTQDLWNIGVIYLTLIWFRFFY